MRGAWPRAPASSRFPISIPIPDSRSRSRFPIPIPIPTQEGYTYQGDFCAPCNPADAYKNWNQARAARRGAAGRVLGASRVACGRPQGRLFTLVAILVILFVLFSANWLGWPLFKQRNRALMRGVTKRVKKGLAPGLSRLAAALKQQAAGSKHAQGSRLSNIVAAAAAAASASSAPPPQSAAKRYAARALTALKPLRYLLPPGTVPTKPSQVKGVLGASVLPLKMIIENLQIVSAFKKTLRLPWPNAFGQILARLSFVSGSFLALPKIACTIPDLNFYNTFNAITLGITVLFAYLFFVWGVVHVAMRRLQYTPEQVTRFDRKSVARLVFVSTIVFAPAVENILAVFDWRARPCPRAPPCAERARARLLRGAPPRAPKLRSQRTRTPHSRPPPPCELAC